MIELEVFEEYGKKRLRELLEKGEKPVIVAGFIDVFGDARLTSCSMCHVPIWVRPWIFQAMIEYDLKTLCICCAEPFAIKDQIMIDFATIEEETRR